MEPSELRQSDVGRALEIATKVKSKPIRGTILELLPPKGGVVRVLLRQGFGNRWHTLTSVDSVELPAN
ncbi:hypothetical protein SEA_BANTAM_110 [Gordonia phage Bantam]|uniref:Uncharacterized protein n=1 Tax=Gordonia phage Bantam TaxID=1887641 RepID=A0A1B3AYG9_9CAUD|nr:hypothetical protein BIZ77_gp069 [Gordonia phage Bantam]AOE43799.1 hypothetical protein SEA_BANTAM_110 [Gordonia phage Bantam]